MLVLSRRPGEKIFINDGEIQIAILEVKGNQVRIGIEAPRSITVHREEIFNLINDPNFND